jgi:hypothetical protein
LPCISDPVVADGLVERVGDQTRSEHARASRETASLERQEVLVEGFGRGLVAERLAGAAVERGGDGLDLFGAPPREVGVT